MRSVWDRNPVRVALVHMLPSAAERLGVPVRRIVASAGVAAHDLSDPGKVLARAQVCTMLGSLAHRGGDPAVGLALGMMADPTRLGTTGLALVSGATLRDRLAAHALAMPGLQSGVRLALTERNGEAVWRHRLADSDPEHAFVLNEGVAAFMAAAIRAAVGDAALTVAFPHRRRAAATVYEDRLAAQVRFNSGEGVALSFPAALLDLPLPDGAPASPTGPRPACETFRDLDGAALAAALGLIFAEAADPGERTLVSVARSLGLPPRTLQRRLAETGDAFEGLLDRWRRAEACRLLGAGSTPIATIAKAVGYRDPSHLARAFRRWTGCAPADYRRRLGDGRPAWPRADMARNGD
jgi:AraC-like DNA-binding protein